MIVCLLNMKRKDLNADFLAPAAIGIKLYRTTTTTITGTDAKTFPYSTPREFTSLYTMCVSRLKLKFELNISLKCVQV